MTSVAVSYTRMKLAGPDATPPVVRTTSPSGRRRLNAKPVPPPDWWISAVCFTLVKMQSRSSSMGSTKQADSCWRSLPAFINVGEFGRNSKRRIIP